MNESSAIFPLFCGTKVSKKEQQLIVEIIDRYQRLSRTELASTLSGLLDWIRPNGKLKTVECRTFLELLHQQNGLTLPHKRAQRKRRKTQITFTQATQAVESLQGPLKNYRLVTLGLIQHDDDRARWKERIERYHYLGYRIPFGAHLRYFIHATQPKTEILGCLQFLSSAWRMAARDQWIGWSDATRGKNLQRLINNSRFLVLPHVHINNLAGHILSPAARQVVDDWQTLYAIKPLLIETRVDLKKFSGGCYRATNWLEVGITCGRGRQDSQHQRHHAAPKRVFVYPLQKKAHEQLRIAP